MTTPFHTYGATCLLADDEPELSSLYILPAPPDVRPQFFHASSLPIDDPLAPLPPVTGQTAGNDKIPPQPFSAGDNIDLENAWRELREARQAKLAQRNSSPPQTAQISRGIAVPGRGVTATESRQKTGSLVGGSLVGSRECVPSNPEAVTEDQPILSTTSRRGHTIGNAGVRAEEPGERRRTLLTGGKSSMPNLNGIAVQRKRDRSSSVNDSLPAKRRNSSSPELNEGPGDERPSIVHVGRSRDASISGSPFIRAPISQSQSPFGRSVESLPPSRDGSREWQAEVRSSGSHHPASKPSRLRASLSRDEIAQDDSTEEPEEEIPQSIIPVGVSRLHLVELPNLKMKPIYWSPLHDISSVFRATWFYKNTMLPVETALANKLEEGYAYLRPWTDTWQDELNSCVENGADAEMKIVYRLWQKDDGRSSNRPGAAQDQKSIDSAEEVAETLTFDKNQAAGGTAAQAEAVKSHLNSSTVYVDGRNAQILRPSLLPSGSRGRRPLSAIRKGRQIGIPVVRGFSRKAWDRLHPSKPNPIDVRHYIRRRQSQSTVPVPGEQICYACKMEETRPQPTDLVLVIHGIGQKLSERMESWHFTHAINAFRREVNVELNNEPVWPHVREDHGGIMVLPVNWRTTLSLDEVNLDSPTSEDPASNRFSLTDITPETLPGVRSMISDVMLDIPYYMSHHKPKMIKAVVREANRIFRLWCHNNPGFQDHGRVHLVAHSLGSVMALDILSHQPTHIPRFDFDKTAPHLDIFEFDTRILFLCGSPAGFFLLLNKSSLLPRRGRDKLGSEGEDRLRGVAGDADRYGCMAVDNLYNIMHTTDPITYCINAAVDTDLSSSLKTASIPASNSSFWQSLGSVFRWSSSTTTTSSTAAAAGEGTALARPTAVTKLPSTVELETHNFTREQIAEKRMSLLNDNGQIDYYLSGGGGPLNFQYLNMLSAHSSYWTLPDFVRFFVIEIARKQGKEGTLLAFRAEKKKGWKYSHG